MQGKKTYQDRRLASFRLSERVPRDNFYRRLKDILDLSWLLFVRHFREQTRGLHGTHKVVLIGDKAGSHQQRVCEQYGICFEPLSTACPELNPVERFFEELRKELSNQVFETIRGLENCLCWMLRKYFDHLQTLVQLCHYPYIRDA